MLRFSASRNAAEVGSIGVATGLLLVGGGGWRSFRAVTGATTPADAVPGTPPSPPALHSRPRTRPSVHSPSLPRPAAVAASALASIPNQPHVSGGPHAPLRPLRRTAFQPSVPEPRPARRRGRGRRSRSGLAASPPATTTARARRREAAVTGARGCRVWQHRPTWRPRRSWLDRLWDRGRVSLRARFARVSAKRWQIAAVRGRRRCRLADRRRPAGPPDAVLRAGRGRGQPRHVLRPAAAARRRGHRRRRARGAARRPAGDHHRLGRVAAHAGRGAGDDVRAADHQRSAVRHPGRGAVDHHLRAGPGAGRRRSSAGPMPWWGARRAGGGHRWCRPLRCAARASRPRSWCGRSRRCSAAPAR